MLYEGTLLRERGTGVEALLGHVTWEWLPRPGLTHEAISQDSEFGMQEFFGPEREYTSPRVRVPDFVSEIPTPLEATNLDLDAQVFATRYQSGLEKIRVGEPEALSEVVFNLINYWALDRGERVELLEGRYILGCSCEVGPWQLDIQNVPRSDRVVQGLGETGGFAFT